MTVIPFPSTSGRASVAFTLSARVDLRVGAPAAGVVRPLGEEALTFSGLARLVRAARATWRARSAAGQISLVLHERAHEEMDAETLDAAALEAGCTHKALTFELDETAVMAVGPTLAERLRARGWGVALRGDPACPLPFGSRARGLYTELVLDADDLTDPFLGIDQHNRAPLSRRLAAAKEAGMVITADNIQSPAQARLL
ncbi:MAG: hypothetical protein AB7L65_03450, partial [Hyphomonadaceae bacterium]